MAVDRNRHDGSWRYRVRAGRLTVVIVFRSAQALVMVTAQYLRTYLAWSGAELAAQMGTTPETVLRWEHGATPMGKTADRLLRLIVATRLPGSEDVLETLRVITATERPQSIRLSLTREQDGWHAAFPVVTM